MNHKVFSVAWRLAALAACIAAGVYAYRLATGYYDPPALVGIVNSQEPVSYLDTADFTAALSDLGCEVRTADPTVPAEESVLQLIEQGAKVVVVGCDAPFTEEEVFSQASAHSTTLLFVGAAPQQALLDGYDKAWALENDAAYGGQLLGKQAALAFRDGTLADADADQLMDCMGLLPGDYPSAGVVGREFLAESEHYGVYSDLHHNFTAVSSELAHSVNELFLPGTESEDPLEDDTAGDASDTAQPEVIFCAGGRAAQTAHELSAQLGWQGTTRIAALAENLQTAQSLRDNGIADYIAYYDEAAATNILAEFTRNALNKRFIAQGCELQPDENKHFIFGYQLLE